MTKEERKKKLVEMKAFRKGQAFGITFCLHVMAWVMVEEMKMDAGLIQTMMDKMEDFCMDFEKKNISLRDMEEVLKDEHHITIKFGNKEA